MTEEMSPSEAARRIGTTTRSVQRWIQAGRLPARRIGDRWRVASDALDAFVAAGTVVQGARTPVAAPPVAAIARATLPSPIGTVFVANRGEIARRIARTCGALGIRSVLAADAPGAIDLLDPRSIVAAALAAGADAVHPGYGFLSEQPALAEAVVEAGLRWVGPPASAMRAMGDKAAARRLAASLGVAVLPGYDADDQSDGALSRAADRIGYPILAKPAGGGGGKGMRMVRRRGDLPDALAAARREAAAAFGDDRLILERYVEGPRHVEVQVLFDEHGQGIHLGERDCSIQRRHQKVLEETPSPAVDAALRARLGEAALRLASAVGYVSAGTCEFLLADDGQFWFLEMNTRLQVEHPVTEAVTGRDLVADQLGIAGGATLASIGLSQAAVDAALAAGGHAVEVRLYAEDAEAGFLPAAGRVLQLHWPAGPGIRVDPGIDEGTIVDERFDPMLAKIVAHGADRTDALARLAAALHDTLVLGLVTNLRFLRWLLRDEAVVHGEARIDTLEARWPPEPLAASPGTRLPDDAWTMAAGVLAELGGDAAEPWAGGWRMNGPARLRLAAEGTERSVSLPVEPDRAAARPTPNDEPDRGAAGPPHRRWVHADGAVHLDIDGRSVAFRLAPSPDVDRAARAARPPHGTGRSTIAAPMPGSVIAVHVVEGGQVSPGDPVATLAAMKMEHVIAAPSPGVVTEVLVRAGDQVARDQPLAIVES